MRTEILFCHYLRQITQTADMFPRLAFTYYDRMKWMVRLLCSCRSRIVLLLNEINVKWMIEWSAFDRVESGTFNILFLIFLAAIQSSLEYYYLLPFCRKCKFLNYNNCGSVMFYLKDFAFLSNYIGIYIPQYFLKIHLTRDGTSVAPLRLTIQ